MIGRSPSKHSGNGRPPPTAVTIHDSPYDSEDAWYAREVAVEYKDFVDEILDESPEAIQITTNTSLAISRDSNANSGGVSNANSGGRSNETDNQQAIIENSNANSGGESIAFDTQQVVNQDSNANSGGQSTINASVPAVLEERDPPARSTSRRTVEYNERYTRDAIVRQDDRYEEAVARVSMLEREVADSRQRVTYLQTLLEEDRGNRPLAQRSIDNQQLIDSLERQLFSKQGMLYSRVRGTAITCGE